MDQYGNEIIRMSNSLKTISTEVQRPMPQNLEANVVMSELSNRISKAIERLETTRNILAMARPPQPVDEFHYALLNLLDVEISNY